MLVEQAGFAEYVQNDQARTTSLLIEATPFSSAREESEKHSNEQSEEECLLEPQKLESAAPPKLPNRVKRPFTTRKFVAKACIERLMGMKGQSKIHVPSKEAISRALFKDMNLADGNAEARLKVKLDGIRQDKDLLYQLHDRVNVYKRQQAIKLKRLSNGRNIMMENMWLCSSKEACEKYWRRLKALDFRVQQCTSVEDQIRLYAQWPHPPGNTHAPGARKSLIRQRALKHAEKVAGAKKARQQLETERIEHLKFVMNKKEYLLEQKRKEEHAALKIASFKLMMSNIVLASRVQVFEKRLIEERLKRQKRSQEIAKIQRNYRKSKAHIQGKRYRAAVKAVRKFALIATFTRRLKRKKKSADIIRLFLSQYQNADFVKLMKNYRYRVIQCQRMFRSYREITKARLKLLTLKWDKLERERIRSEQRHAKAEVLKASRKASQANVEKRKSALKRGSTAKNFVARKSTLHFALAGMKTPASSLRRKLSKAQKINSNIAAFAAAAELGITVYSRVPIKIKRGIIKDMLISRRGHFKAMMNRKRQEAVVKNREENMISVDDVKRLLTTSSKEEETKLLEEKFGFDFDKTRLGPMLMLLLKSVTNEVMNEYIDQGRQAADDELLNRIGSGTPVPGTPDTNVTNGTFATSSVFLTAGGLAESEFGSPIAE